MESDIGLGGSGLCGPVSESGHGGAALRGVQMVSAVALAVCLWVLVLCLFRGLGRGQAGHGLMVWQDFWSFSHAPSCLLFYFVYGYYSNLLFLSNSIFFFLGEKLWHWH